MAKKKDSSYRAAMLIDDNEIDNFIHQKLLQGIGFADKVYVHTSGRSALEFLENLAMDADALEKLRPEVIFLDINMPIMDGYQFYHAFRKLPEVIHKGVKIIVLTSSINPNDDERFMTFDDVVGIIHKPLNEAHLQEYRTT